MATDRVRSARSAGPVAIVGQGIAGTLVAAELERHGIPFHIWDPGLSHSASAVAAGIINPVMGRRFVPLPEAGASLAEARDTYQALERRFNRPLWQDMRIRREFVDSEEREILESRRARGELEPFLGAVDAQGFWIRGAARVDLSALLQAARADWRARGCLTETAADLEDLRQKFDRVILCAGAGLLRLGLPAEIPSRLAQGEILEVDAPELEPDVIRSRRFWVLPREKGRAEVGATYVPDRESAEPTSAGREELRQAAERLLDRAVEVRGHRAGVRLTTSDHRSAIGWLPTISGCGVLGGLGSRGAATAPGLARQWRRHLLEGAPFESEVAVDRFARP